MIPKLTYLREDGKVHTPEVGLVIHEDGREWVHEEHEEFDYDERSFEVEAGEYVCVQTRDGDELNAFAIPWNKIASVNYFYPSFEGGGGE